jgi:hypothetical protein
MRAPPRSSRSSPRRSASRSSGVGSGVISTSTGEGLPHRAGRHDRGMSKKGKSTERIESPSNPEQMAKRGTQNIPDPQKKSSGHRKKTADKWNQ